MRKASVISFAVLFVMAGQAISNGEWCDVEIVPEHPTSCDVVVITLSGQWGNSCTPNASAISVDGNDIYFDVTWDYSPGICLDVLTPWELTRSVGPLAPGTYYIYARLFEYSQIPGEYTLMAEFTVTAESCVPTVYYVDAADGNDLNDGLTPGTAFATIKKGVDTARSGDTVIVTPGIYIGEGNRDINFYCKAIVLRSTNPSYPNVVAGTIIDCEGTYDSAFNFHSNEGPNSVLTGFTITNAYSAIRCRDYSCPTITNCHIVANQGASGGGIHCSDYSSPRISNCAISDNSASFYGAGIYVTHKCNPTIINCLLNGNSSSDYGGGIWCSNDSNPTIINCTIWSNSARKQSGGGLCNFSSGTTITNSILWGNSDSGGTDESAQIHGTTPIVNYCCVQGWTGALGGTGNIDSDPLFMDADGADNVPGTGDDNLRLRPESPCVDAGDNSAVPLSVLTDFDEDPRIINGTVDIGAYENPKQGFLLSTKSVIIPEGGTATFAVSLAMDPNGTVEVTVYRESGDSDITVESGGSLTFDSSNYSLPQTITLRAAEDEDYLYGEALISVSSAGFLTDGVKATEEDSGPIPAVLFVDADAQGANYGPNWEDAFTDLQDALSIAEEFPEVTEIRVAQGIYTPAGPSGSRNATFQLLNGVTIKGGYASFGEPNPDARNVHYYETILSGDLNSDDGHNFANNGENSYHVVTSSGTQTDETAVLDGFTITGGNANGSALEGKSNGGGIYIKSGSSPTIRNCTIRKNTALYHGGGICNNVGTILINCMFIGNSSGREGGGIYNYCGSPTLINCAFLRNSTGHGSGHGGDGGGMYNGDSSSPTITNCIFWGNRDDDDGRINESTQIRCGEAAVVNYCCIQGWTSALGGTGNIGDNPLFADPDNDDYHLKSTAGRWDPDSQSWVTDANTSLCIDAGNPGCPLGDEPEDANNVRINMGAYGGTAEASKTPANWGILADLTNDRIIDFNDLAAFVDYWLESGECIPSDLNRNQSVNFLDYAVFAQQWLDTLVAEAGIEYEITPCDMGSSAAGQSGETRFTVTVQGRYILFEDMMVANCCPDEVWLEMEVDNNQVTVYEREAGGVCLCICDYHVTATLGPFEPGTYTLEVYEDWGGFIGSTTITME